MQIWETVDQYDDRTHMVGTFLSTFKFELSTQIASNTIFKAESW